MENELFTHSFRSGWGDFNTITVYENKIVHEVVNWGDVDFIEPSEFREEYTHQLFYDYHKNEEKYKVITEFLVKRNMVNTTQE